ncbi:DUF4184 family protein [Micromonospora echinaurantiaca]|uniref:DUF4184 family protein n=1 Tax=Micromonospora echinaurantiaca TaxID=47857 RepID=UPI0037ACB6B7
MLGTGASQKRHWSRSSAAERTLVSGPAPSFDSRRWFPESPAAEASEPRLAVRRTQPGEGGEAEVPFTGSHVAAVLPLTRSAWLVPSALVIGSMVPDLPYYLPLPVEATLTHSLAGVLGVDVVLGLVALALWHGLLARFLTAISPARLRERLPPPARQRHWPTGRAAMLVVSLVVGAATHVLWDSFTHDGMWGATHIGWLAESHLGTAGYRWAQRVSTIVGAAAVVVWLVRWWQTQSPTPATAQRPLAERVLVVAAWTAIGLAATSGAALAATEEVAPQRMVFLAVTQAGGAGLTTAIVFAACYAVLARHDQSTPR